MNHLIEYLQSLPNIEQTIKNLFDIINEDLYEKSQINIMINCLDRYDTLPIKFIQFIETRGIEPQIKYSIENYNDPILNDLFSSAYPEIISSNEYVIYSDYSFEHHKLCSREYLIDELKRPGLYNEKSSAKVMRIAKIINNDILIRNIENELILNDGCNEELARTFIQNIETYGLIQNLNDICDKIDDLELIYLIQIYYENS